MKNKKFQWICLGIASIVMLLAGFAFAQGDPKYTKVRFGILPYFDYCAWPIATELGWDKELELELEFVKFIDDPTAAAAISRGDVDCSGACIGVIVATFPQTPNVRFFNNGVQYFGNCIECRKGEYKTYKDFRVEGLSEKDAIRVAISQMKGKTIISQKGVFDVCIAQALEQVDLSMDDINFIDMEQAIGAAAFMRGTGDFYKGGFPQHLKLRKTGKFVPLVEAGQMGLAGLWFSNNETSEEYYKAHKDIVIKLNAIWFRMVRLMHEHREASLPLMGRLLNKVASANFNYEDVEFLFDHFVKFVPMEEVKKKFLNPESPSYYKRFIDYMIEFREAEGIYPKGLVKAEDMSIIEEVQMAMESNEELMNWINKPFTKEEISDRRYLLE